MPNGVENWPLMGHRPQATANILLPGLKALPHKGRSWAHTALLLSSLPEEGAASQESLADGLFGWKHSLLGASCA